MTNSITRRGAEQWKIPLEGGAVRADYAEKLLIGSSLVEFEKCREAIADLDRSAIVSDAHRTILEAMAQLANEQRPVDAATVFDRLTEIGKVPEIPEGVNYLLELMDQSEGYSPSHVAEWVEIINTKGEVRRFQQGLEDLAKLAASGAAIEGLRSNLLRLGEALPQVGYRGSWTNSSATGFSMKITTTMRMKTAMYKYNFFWRGWLGWLPVQSCLICGKWFWAGVPWFNFRDLHWQWWPSWSDYCSKSCCDQDLEFCDASNH